LNPRARVESVLHELLPAALTLVVAKRLGNDKDGLEHYDLRRDAARCVADVCAEFGDKYVTLRPRVAQTYADALKDSSKPLAVTFGAVTGVHALGPLAVSKLLVPRAPDLARHILLDAAKDDGVVVKKPKEAAASEGDASSNGGGTTTEELPRKKQRWRRHQADVARLLALDALALAVSQDYLRPLVLTYVERPDTRLEVQSPPRKRRRGGGDDSRSRRPPRTKPRSDLSLLDTFGEATVPFCATIPSSVFL